MSNGSIVGTEAEKLERNGETYTFIDDIHAQITVQRSGITINGDGYTLNGTVWNSTSGWWEYLSDGFTLNFVNDVTIQNVNIVDFILAFSLAATSGVTIQDNIVSSTIGVIVANSTYVEISENSFSNFVSVFNVNSDFGSFEMNSITCYGGFEIAGMLFDNSDYNTLRQNYIQHWILYGVLLQEGCDNNEIYYNTFNDNEDGLFVGGMYNTIYLNDFMDNAVHCGAGEYPNVWNRNYWDTYDGTDSDGDLIGDTPNVITANNIDNEPLMLPWEEFINFPKEGGMGWTTSFLR
ncbi:MAG: right-handed parallel beta-helix repeat-containing protein [Candidatus Bathyarchaeota archaeon]|nr:right-handed parallel beta-helix repeat-containing protein [Candidatus Bathyarchaeota archaeon]